MENSAKPGDAGGDASASSTQPPIPSPPERTPSQSSLHKGIPSHRQSFAENLRNAPGSPRSQRHPSFTQAAVQELLNNPSSKKQPNPKFAGRDWRDITLGELTSPEDVTWAEMDTSVEEATKTLLKNGSPSVVLVRASASENKAVSTFDYSDLNAYLLAVVGLAKPEGDLVEVYDDLARRAQDRQPIPLRDIQPICRREQVVTLGVEAPLPHAIETFGSGVHRLLVTDGTSDVVGILSQLKIVEFFWNEGVNFPNIDRLYPLLIRDLHIGTRRIIAVNADAPLAEALTLMHNEGLTSVAVVDSGLNVVGNISTADVKHLTSAASLPLLQSSCMHFISVILSERGVEKGRDSFPVFYVNPYSSLARTVAKLVATRSHRMWLVESPSPSPSAPATPLLAPVGVASAPQPAAGGPTVVVPSTSSAASSAPQSPLPLPPSSPSFGSVPAPAMPGAHLSGRLTGVVSLTDVLNLFARSSGLNPADPGEQRARRRRSSSSSVRPSLDSSRASADLRR